MWCRRCVEGDKERQLLFRTGKGLKVQDTKGKTLAKSDGYAGVSIKLDAGSAAGFTLALGGKKQTTFQLTAPAGVRDLCALVLQAFANKDVLDSLPVVPTATSGSALHLSAVGGLTTPKEQGGGASPASSMTSEQQSLADVDEGALGKGAPSSSAADARKSSSKLGIAGRKLSFTRNSKRK